MYNTSKSPLSLQSGLNTFLNIYWKLSPILENLCRVLVKAIYYQNNISPTPESDKNGYIMSLHTPYQMRSL